MDSKGPFWDSFNQTIKQDYFCTQKLLDEINEGLILDALTQDIHEKRRIQCVK